MSENCGICSKPVKTDRVNFPQAGVLYHGYCWDRVQETVKKVTCQHRVSYETVPAKMGPITVQYPKRLPYCAKCGEKL